jgi:hypothetical protein
MLTNRAVNKFVLKKYAFCANGTFLGSFISAHETWDQHSTCFVFLFSVITGPNRHTTLFKVNFGTAAKGIDLQSSPLQGIVTLISTECMHNDLAVD